MTAPAKAAPMREDVTQADWEIAYEFTRSGFMGGSDGIEILARLAARHRLAHTARPAAGDEDVERVARGIYDATHADLRNCYSWDDRWEDHQEAGRERYYKEARAALAAMREGVDRGMVEVPREPTLAMEQAVWTMSTDDYSHGQIYTAMIAAALDTEQPR